jgi:hypothetical protein
VTAIQATGIKGDMRRGTRYWTLAEMQALQAHIQGPKIQGPTKENDHES